MYVCVLCMHSDFVLQLGPNFQIQQSNQFVTLFSYFMYTRHGHEHVEHREEYWTAQYLQVQLLGSHNCNTIYQ